MIPTRTLLLHALLASIFNIPLALALTSREPVTSPTPPAFNPRAYAAFEKDARCPAIDRTEPNEQLVDININYVDVNTAQNARGTIIMVHGWPGLWSIWVNQITHFRSDYRLLVPNLRGFSKSTHPGDVHSGGTLSDFVSDLICILDDAGVEQAVCMGHDWGSAICFEAARQRPDRFKAVVGLVVPYFPSVGKFIPTMYLQRLAPLLAYQYYFSSRTKDAVEELNASVRRTLRAVVRGVDNPPPKGFLSSTTDFLGVFQDAETEPIVFMSAEEEDYFVEGIEMQGFEKTLQFYVDGNRSRSHAFAAAQGNHTIHTPSLLILPSHDRVANWRDVLKLLQTEQFMTNLVIRDVKAAHWPHMEVPGDVNGFAEEFLDSLSRDGSTTGRTKDEL